jgi:hypothetical protein
MITHEEVRETFPGLSLLVVQDRALDQEFTNTDARRILTEVGLPRGVGEQITFDPRIRDKVRSAEEVLTNYDDGTPDRPRHRYLIGTLWGDLIMVDGKSGTVYQMPEEGEFSYNFLSSSLDKFVELLCYLQKGIDRVYAPELSTEQWDEGAAQLAADAMVALRELDPEAYAHAESIWRDIVESLVFAD